MDNSSYKREKICVKVHDDVIYASTNRGLPQGGGLSPTLWSMIADSLLKWLSKCGVYAQGYADDGVVLVIGIVLSTVCEIMQRDLPCDLPCAASLAGIQPVRPRAQRTSP